MTRNTRIVLAALFFILAANTTYAQIAVGLRGGVNLAIVSDQTPIDVERTKPQMIAGLSASAFVEIGISPLFAIQPEVSYVQKGARYDVSFDQIDFAVREQVNYLEIPVLAKFRFGNDQIRGFALAGPSVGYALNGKFKVEAAGETFKEDIEFDDDFDVDGVKDNRFDISAVVGAGLELGAGPGDIVVDARYAHDLNDFTRFEGDKPDGYKGLFSRGLAISVGYRLPLGRK